MTQASLTRHLANPRSPLSRFMADQLPGQRMCALYTATAASLGLTIRPSGPLDSVPWPVLGTAIDTRIRILLGEKRHPATARGIAALREIADTPAASPGHALKFAPYQAAADAGDILLDRLATYAQTPHPMDEAMDIVAARAVIIAARYEAIHRAPPTAVLRAMGHFTELRLPPDPLHALHQLSLEIPAAWSEDIRRQCAAAARTLAPLQGHPLHCAPVLEGAADVGEAEPDLISGRTLLDIKATIDPYLRPAQARSWFHQLAGYLLLDYHDRWQIEKVGVYLSRQHTLLTWDVNDFLRMMGARASLSSLRQRLRATLKPPISREYP